MMMDCVFDLQVDEKLQQINRMKLLHSKDCLDKNKELTRFVIHEEVLVMF